MYLKDLQPAGGYKVRWDDDSSETEVRPNALELVSGGVTEGAYNEALARITMRLGGITEKPEKGWVKNGRMIASSLVVAKPAYLKPGQELHAHVGNGGVVLRAHVKSGEKYVRVICDGGVLTNVATLEDKAWITNYKLRMNLKQSKQAYLDSKLTLPE